MRRVNMTYLMQPWSMNQLLLVSEIYSGGFQSPTVVDSSVSIFVLCQIVYLVWSVGCINRYEVNKLVNRTV